MNPHTIKRLFPRASASLLAANAHDYGTPNDDHANNPRKTAELECHPGNAPLETREGKEASTGRIRVRVVSVRKRLCDEDNLCEKQLVDCLRYCGAIPDDSPEKVGIETTQRRVREGEEEHTEVTIKYPDPELQPRAKV